MQGILYALSLGLCQLITRFLVLEGELGEGSFLSKWMGLYTKITNTHSMSRRKSKSNVSSCPPKTREKKGERGGQTSKGSMYGCSSLPSRFMPQKILQFGQPVGSQRKWSFLTLWAALERWPKYLSWGASQFREHQWRAVRYSGPGYPFTNEPPIFSKMCNLKQVTCLPFSHGIYTFTQTAALQLASITDFRSRLPDFS